jgi:hypothetical protein
VEQWLVVLAVAVGKMLLNLATSGKPACGGGGAGGFQVPN